MSSERRGRFIRTGFSSRPDRRRLDRGDHRGAVGAAAAGADAARSAGAILEEGHRAGGAVPAAAQALCVVPRQRAFLHAASDYFNWPSWTYFYDTAPLRATLTQLVDLDALADKSAAPGLLVSATDVGEGQIEYFYSREKGLTLDHIVASGSLPPAFPPTVIDGATYWDGGLFDNTPLGAVLDKLGAAGPEATVYVVNLFPNKAPLPQNLMQVEARIKNLQFANKTTEDLRLLRRFNEVAALMMALDDALAATRWHSTRPMPR